jgi:adenylate cyclase
LTTSSTLKAALLRWLPASPTAGLTVIGNLAGALATFSYFRFVDPLAYKSTSPVGAGEILYFVVGFGLLATFGSRISAGWLQPLTRTPAAPPAGPEGDEIRRRALLVPGMLALTSFAGWALAAMLWGVVWPLLAGDFSASRALRQIFGIMFVAGTIVPAVIYFGSERRWRKQLPRLFPNGELSTVRVPRLRLRARMIAVFLLVGLVPLAVLAVAALSRANALRTADAATAAAIIQNLIIVVAVLAIGGLIVSIGLAALVGSSIAEPLRDLQSAMRQVERGSLDARCAVISNDEIGAVAEGFNRMVGGLRERETIRETFGKYVSPEVRDEILAGRASLSGGMREVSILFSDLRDFTPWVESHPAAEVVADLNEYFTEMDGAIRAHRGLVLQFIGDEIEAVFGAPLQDANHAESAVRAALQMRKRLEALNVARRALGKIELRHGIGVHTGVVLAGNIGSSTRLSYALVGDAVNVASRIQNLNKEFGTDLLLSGATRARLDSRFEVAPLPRVRVKGRSAEVEVFSLV